MGRGVTMGAAGGPIGDADRSADRVSPAEFAAATW